MEGEEILTTEISSDWKDKLRTMTLTSHVSNCDAGHGVMPYGIAMPTRFNETKYLFLPKMEFPGEDGVISSDWGIDYVRCHTNLLAGLNSFLCRF